MPVTIGLGGLGQLLNLTWRQVLTATVFAIRQSYWRKKGRLHPIAYRRFIEEIIERSVNDRERRGCFLINSALEVAPHDREAERPHCRPAC